MDLGALSALVLTGIVLLISEPVRNMVNSIFWMKMVLLAVAIAGTFAFHRSVRGQLATWEASPAGHATLRSGAIAVTLLWCAVITGGRWIAYAPV